jgi:hypothetical protein
VQINLTITNNVLTVPATLRASMNGVIVGDIVINPGDAAKVAFFNTAFVNPANTTRDVGANLYGQAPH